MIYTCSYCRWRINTRQHNIPLDSIGTFIYHKHRSFCSKSCVDAFESLKTKPKYDDTSADWYEDEWKKNRKLTRPKRLKRLNF